MKTIIVSKPTSKGIVMGNAFIAIHKKLEADTTMICDEEKEQEISKFHEAVDKAVEELKHLSTNSEIFTAHLDVVQDFVLHEKVTDKINNENKNAQLALEETKEEICYMFESLDDEYLKERSEDIKDVCGRVMRMLMGVQHNPFEDINGNVIVVAEDLSPSDTVNMDFNNVIGFITETGGVTSHVSIIARCMEIPAIIGVNDFINEISDDDYLILDAVNGVIIVNPDESTKLDYIEKAQKYENVKKKQECINSLPASTIDGRTVELNANVCGIAEVENAVRHGADGIGLFRSEFLYMESKAFPSEQEQFEVYKKAVETNKKVIVIRTLDIGGDKELPYYKFDHEENPYLGWRAIRVSLDLKDVFKTQLKAILRASAFGDVRIMYPMIISVDEFLEANGILEECKHELREGNIAFNQSIQTGIMVETPAAVICANDLAQVVDFFSIGTNDLTQYILAVDRGNRKISKLYNSFNPAVLKSIRHIIDAGHKYGIKVCMCGELAGNEKAIPILLGMGLDEFSMASGDIAEIRHIIRKLSYEKSKEFAELICSKVKIKDIMELLE